MPTEPSNYAENQFESTTRDNASLMSEILADVMPRIAAAVATNLDFAPVYAAVLSANTDWDNAESTVANAEAAQISTTAAFEDKLRSLTRKPNLDTNSPIEQWDSTIRSQVAYNGTTYLILLPHGRETLTAGTYLQQLDAIRDFGVRLAQQIANPVLVALGGTVTSFYNEANNLRLAQMGNKTALDNARTALESLREQAAAALYGMVGFGIWTYRANPSLVDTLFDVNILRNPAQTIPAPGGLPVWTPANRTLTLAAMPNGATRQEVWREGPGGMPELLIIGARGALSVQIPANITFDIGDLYQLWMQSRNSRGSSGPGPKVSWEAE